MSTSKLLGLKKKKRSESGKQITKKSLEFRKYIHTLKASIEKLWESKQCFIEKKMTQRKRDPGQPLGPFLSLSSHLRSLHRRTAAPLSFTEWVWFFPLFSLSTGWDHQPLLRCLLLHLNNNTDQHAKLKQMQPHKYCSLLQ